MDRILFVVFDDKKKAYEGSRILEDLHYEGSITLYASAVLAKNDNGEITIEQADEPGPVGTGIGLITGSLLGVLGGPAGLAFGAGVGMYGGILYDLARLGIGEDFLYDVGQYLLPGKTAVVAEVWEEWILPVDTRMTDAGGFVFRRAREDVEDIQIERDIGTLNREISELKTEWSRASGEARNRVQARLDNAKSKMQAMRDGIKEKVNVIQNETDTKVQMLQEQINKVREDQRAKIQAHIGELNADLKQRSEKLQKAWELTSEALRG